MAGYGTDEGFTAWRTANGHGNLPAGVTAAAMRERGSSYIDGTYGPRFSGVPTGGFEQERAWPRTGATAYGQEIGASVIPSAVVNASYAAAWQEASQPGSLSVTGSAATAVKREKVEGAVEVEYQAQKEGLTAESLTPVLTTVEGLLAPFLTRQTGIPAVMVL
jgi:hypothetical protein